MKKTILVTDDNVDTVDLIETILKDEGYNVLKAYSGEECLRKLAKNKVDLVVIGPGDLYTSVLPNLLVQGIPEAIRNTQGKVIYVVNLMTKRGETDNFTARDFVGVIEKYLGEDTLDAVVVNKVPPPAKLLRLYREKGHVAPVEYREELFAEKGFAVIPGKFVRPEGRYIRHDPKRLSRALLAALKARRRSFT